MNIIQQLFEAAKKSFEQALKDKQPWGVKGRKIQVGTAYKNKKHPAHSKAVQYMKGFGKETAYPKPSDLSHLHALEDRLAREHGRLANAKTEKEKQLRRVWIAQIEKEISDERIHLGMPSEKRLPHMSDDELLAELGIIPLANREDELEEEYTDPDFSMDFPDSGRFATEDEEDRIGARHKGKTIPLANRDKDD